MPLLAMWFPSVGTFGIVLAVMGSIVAILAFRAWKGIGLALIFILLGIGEIVSIDKADTAHEIEVRNQHSDIESLTREFHNSEMQRQVETAVLRTKLEDYAGLSQLGPALMKLAQTSAKIQKKQYESKVVSDQALYNLTMKAAAKIRGFSMKYTEVMSQRQEALMKSISGPASEIERRQTVSDEMRKNMQLCRAKQSEFQIIILPDAIYARNELVKRNLPEPLLKPSQKTDLNVVFGGTLAGVNPELSLATYLELWAKPLAGK
jgi:hypothetical protein